MVVRSALKHGFGKAGVPYAWLRHVNDVRGLGREDQGVRLGIGYGRRGRQIELIPAGLGYAMAASSFPQALRTKAERVIPSRSAAESMAASS